MDKLKPCPFCGSKDAPVFDTVKEAEDCKYFEDEEKCPAFQPYGECRCKRIVCSVKRGGCGASTGFSWDELKAIEKWNRRADT